MGRSTDRDEVERAEQVSEVDGAAEAGDRVGRVARRPQRPRGVPRTRDLGGALLGLARPAVGGRAGALRRQGGAPGRAGAASQGRRARACAWPQDLRVGDCGKTVAGVELSVRVARSRELVAEGYPLSVVACAARISRQAIYRVPRPRAVPQRRPVSDLVEQAIVEIAQANQTDGYRMVTRSCAASSDGR